MCPRAPTVTPKLEKFSNSLVIVTCSDSIIRARVVLNLLIQFLIIISIYTVHLLRPRHVRGFVQKRPIRGRQSFSAAAFGFTIMWYGKGFASVVVIGGMWSLSRFTIAMILCAAFSSDLLMARRTLITSGWVSQIYCRFEKPANVPASVLGCASVTSSVHCSQHTSSSALPKK